MNRRLADVQADVAASALTGLLVTSLPSVRWLSGFSGSSGYVLVEPDAATLFTDFRYETQAAEELAAGLGLSIMSEGTWRLLGEHLAESPPGRRIGFEAGHLPVAEHERLTAACDNVIWEPTLAIVERRRAVKDEAEVESIAAAADLADLVLEGFLPRVRAGVTESELAARLEYELRVAGSGPLPFAPIVASGERSALPHAGPSDRRLARGDLLLLDFGARVDGYCSDMTRVFTLGPPDPWQRDLHAAVWHACEVAVAAVAPGVGCAEVDAAARGALEAVGLAERFRHSTGHGLGLEIHEAPRLHHRETGSLQVGNVVTVEPGVYLPGQGGIRIEQIATVEAGGARILTRSSPELIQL